jgi:hypothetical protein
MKSRQNSPIQRRKNWCFIKKMHSITNQSKRRQNLHELDYELLSHPLYSPDLAPRDLFLFADLKRMLAGKNFNTNEEVITKIEAYFEAMSKSYFKNGIEKLYDRYNRCIAHERNYKIRFFTRSFSIKIIIIVQ